MGNRKLFIGSSKEAADSGAFGLLSSELSHRLPPTIEVISWQDTDWLHLESALRTLTQTLTEYSYAVFLGWPDDKLEMRGKKYYCCRDNVIFEFGLFLGQLGTKRTFLVAPKEGVRLPPDDLEYHILTDILGTYRAGSYTITGSPPTARFELETLIQKITQIESDIAAFTPELARDELDRRIQKAKSLVDETGRPDAYYSGLLRNTVDWLVNLKAIESQKPVQDAAKDLLLFVEYEQDVCDLKQLTRVQHHSVGNWDEVWVFADSPLEFQATKNDVFEELRKTIRENLLNGVRYKYFLTESGHRSLKLDLIISKNLPPDIRDKMRKNITFILVDKRLFKTYFTLHFPKTASNPTVYMSALRQERKRDFLIQIADAKHVERIRENIELLFGKEDTINDVMVRRFV